MKAERQAASLLLKIAWVRGIGWSGYRGRVPYKRLIGRREAVIHSTGWLNERITAKSLEDGFRNLYCWLRWLWQHFDQWYVFRFDDVIIGIDKDDMRL
jgi:hypothetical protein